MGTNYLQEGGRCVEGGIQYRPHGSRFMIFASPTDAPEECESFYWDPLLSAVEGASTHMLTHHFLPPWCRGADDRGLVGRGLGTLGALLWGASVALL